MPKFRVTNDSVKLLPMYLEPWGTDHWMKPGEKFTVVVEETGHTAPEGLPFEVAVSDDGISVWVNNGGEASVFDQDGCEAECAHQRPAKEYRPPEADAVDS